MTDTRVFSWGGEPEFTPPGKDGGLSACATHEFTSARISELKTLLEIFLNNILATTSASAGIVRLIAPDGLTFPVISAVGFSARALDEAERLIDCEVGDPANCMQQVSDIRNCKTRQSCQHHPCVFQSMISTPLESAHAPHSPPGILTLFFNTPSEEAGLVRDTVAAYAEMMSASIEHTNAIREAQRIDRLAARMVIANEIHDSLAQTLTYARMRVSLLLEAIRSENSQMSHKYASDLDEALEIAQKSARELVANFRCEINHGGLSAALHDLACEFRRRCAIELEYHNRLVDLELPLEFEIQIYNIVREALSNISRHSGATHARIYVDARFGYYIFTIEDNGRGAGTFTPVEGHYGMLIMKERAHRIGGTIRVDSKPGSGTRLQLFFLEPPLDWRATNE